MNQDVFLAQKRTICVWYHGGRGWQSCIFNDFRLILSLVWSVPWFHHSQACFEIVDSLNQPLGSHVFQRMWFPRYEQSINPLLPFHFGILTVLVNFLGRLILFHAMVMQLLWRVSELPVQSTPLMSQEIGAFLDDCANSPNCACR